MDDPARKNQKATILVVDDSVAGVRLLELQLSRAGYRVLPAYSGEEALACVETQLPDLIILDVMMPGLDGLTVCRQLKADRRTWFIPIVLLTALNQIQDRIQGLEAGADDFLSKPFNREELLARVRSLLRLKYAHDALQTERNRLALLYNISQEINSRLALDELLSKIVTLTRDALAASMCSIILFGKTPDSAQQIISRVGQPPRVVGSVTPAILHQGLAAWVQQHQTGTIVHDATQDRRWLVLPGDTEAVGSAIAAPLPVGQEIIGVLLLTHPQPGFFNGDHLTLLTSIAAQAAITVRNARLYEQAQEEREKLAAVLGGTTDAVLVTDQEGRLILANPAAEQTFGLKVEQALGRPVQEILPDRLLELFARVAASGQPDSVEVSADGGQALYVSVSPVAGVGQVAVVQDITPLKELETMRLQAEQEQRHRLRQIFERYISPELVDRILAQEAGILERRERQEVVVLFADLRGFTRLTSSFAPGTVIEVLNEFFTEMVQVVYRHQGTVFDLAGDELMVGFGAPFAQEDAAPRALHTAGEMQAAFARLCRRWREERGMEVGLGVGIDQGTVVMGNIGAPSHMNFGMVGNAVNTAHLLVEMAQHGQIIVSEAVVGSLGGTLPGWRFEPLPAVEIKGRGAPVCIYWAIPPPIRSESLDDWRATASSCPTQAPGSPAR